MPERLDTGQVIGLFGDALERPPAERQEFLAAAARDDAVRREVVSLLAAHEQAIARPEQINPEQAAAILADESAAVTEVGRRIGPYRVIRELGHGGMGVVYLAERADGAYQQQVALKLVPIWLRSGAQVQRFLRERQILARLEHPGIARLLDGGLADEGEPYFVLEHVEGEPVTTWCDERRLGVNERLRLFVRICEAVQYAHRQLVVHRDLKPSIILVTASGEVKLLDFGIAKLLAGEDPEAAALTQASHLPLTPGYAAPEQRRGAPITTATDVYSLGVLLHELIVGRRPRDAGAVDLARGSRAGRLRGDLDVIVSKALHEEPERRYGSAESLAADIRRYLEGHPISARPAGVAYRAGRFVRRHRIGVVTTAAVILFVSALTVVHSTRLARERDAAEREAATAERVVEFVSELFRAADPYGPREREATVQELLDLGAERIAVELPEEPEIQARLMTLIGGAYHGLSLEAKARPLLERAVEIRRARLGADHPELAESLHKLGQVHYFLGHYDEARPLLDEALRIREATLGPVHADVGATLNALGLLERRLGQPAEARTLLERALAIREQTLGPWDEQTAIDLNNLGLVYQSLGDLQLARRSFERALAIHERNRGPDHPLVAGTLSNLGEALRQSGDLASALPPLERALAIGEVALGPDHRNTADWSNTLGSVYADLKRYDDARRLFERAIGMYRRALGPDHPYGAFATENLGHVERAIGEHDRALALYDRALEIRLKAFGSEHVLIAQSLEFKGGLLVLMGDCRGAEPVLRRALELGRRLSRPDHSRIGRASSALGSCLAATGRMAEAEPLLLEGVRILQAEEGPIHEDTRMALSRTAAMYQAWGKPTEASSYARAAADRP